MSRPVNVSNEAQVKESAQAAKHRRDKEVSDVAELLSLPSGRRFLWRLLEQAGVYKQSFNGGSETFFNEGQRKIGLWALAEIMEINPDSYLLMIKEHRKGEESNV